MRASVCVEGDYGAPFDMREGVRQGCPASPLLFSLYMDRLERFLSSEVLASLSARELDAIRLVGLLLPMLLFADDIVFLATSRAVMQRLLDGLSTFCEANGLTVSTAKTKWLLGGAVP